MQVPEQYSLHLRSKSMHYNPTYSVDVTQELEDKTKHEGRAKDGTANSTVDGNGSTLDSIKPKRPAKEDHSLSINRPFKPETSQDSTLGEDLFAKSNNNLTLNANKLTPTLPTQNLVELSPTIDLLQSKSSPKKPLFQSQQES